MGFRFLESPADVLPQIPFRLIDYLSYYYTSISPRPPSSNGDFPPCRTRQRSTHHGRKTTKSAPNSPKSRGGCPRITRHRRESQARRVVVLLLAAGARLRGGRHLALSKVEFGARAQFVFPQVAVLCIGAAVPDISEVQFELAGSAGAKLETKANMPKDCNQIHRDTQIELSSQGHTYLCLNWLVLVLPLCCLYIFLNRLRTCLDHDLAPPEAAMSPTCCTKILISSSAL